MNETSTPDLIPITIRFRGMVWRECPTYRVTPDTLAAISADWQRTHPATPLAAAIQRDPNPQVYQVFSHEGNQRALMFRIEDVLCID